MPNLTDEIVQADSALQEAEERVTEASRQLRQSRRKHRECREELSRLIKELKTGESRYPLLERFEASGESTSPNGQNDHPPDLATAIFQACKQIGRNGESGHWELLRQQGCDDAKILEVLRDTWPSSPVYTLTKEPGMIGRTIRGGATPAIWIGARKTKDQTPTLSGIELADWVRRVFKIPRAPEPEPTLEPEAVGKHARKPGL